MCDLWFFYSANKPLFTFLTLPNKPLLVFCWLLCWFHCWFSQPQKTVEKREKGSEMIYTSRGMRRRGDSDKWEVVLSHHDPLSGEQVPTYHTVEAKTEKQARRKRDELILELERKGAAATSKITVREFMTAFVDYKEKAATVEPSTIRGYRKDASLISRYIGDVQLRDLGIAEVNGWMAQMTEEGYSPKTVTNPFRLLKQALKWAVAQDILTKNPCDFCKPPKRSKTKINALNREERTRMLGLARQAPGQPLSMAIELALTTGMRRGEICALRWSDLNDDCTITVSHAFGLKEGGYYLKEPKTHSSARTIPLTKRTFEVLRAMHKDSTRILEGMGVRSADPFILGTQEPDSRPYNPSLLGKEYAAFCKMNGFNCTFHDLRHTFATMMIAAGTDVRTVASYLGHSSVSMTLNIYADVDPDAKLNAVEKIMDSFDMDMDSFFGDDPLSAPAPQPQVPGITFTIEQLEALLAQAKRSQGITV